MAYFGKKTHHHSKIRALMVYIFHLDAKNEEREGQDGPVSLTWLPDKFQVNWPFGSKEVQYRFSRWRPSWISNQNDFSYFSSTSHLDTSWSFGSIGLLVKDKKVQNRFSTWLLGQPSWIFDQNDFSYFWSTSHSDTAYQVSSQLAFQFWRS